MRLELCRKFECVLTEGLCFIIGCIKVATRCQRDHLDFNLEFNEFSGGAEKWGGGGWIEGFCLIHDLRSMSTAPSILGHNDLISVRWVTGGFVVNL
jgi:hypothetical protein